ncbi:GNAT family N-acetyltransferase [Roseovarius sp. S4756]|uniref:GNAT family N-acetyltransferase n=1 Tax=Roseovarius maritimus TaxID=3342637 RepID=UPI00372B849B
MKYPRIWQMAAGYPQYIDARRGFRARIHLTCRLREGQIAPMLIIEPASPLAPGPHALLTQSHAMMQELFEPEENYFLGFEALCAPEVHFVAARRDGEVLGTGALVVNGGYGEIKSMFTAAEARGHGVAAAILRALEDHARQAGISLLRLETADVLAGAVRLYERHGYVRCGLFGDYAPNDVSVYMEKAL